mmetsp:Transcript_9436/g.22020  ORF Transcript_9436/g.22020 Transcript_9436/m.22020 type:complete len:268 (-) Transcript_9436:299-1102(-)
MLAKAKVLRPEERAARELNQNSSIAGMYKATTPRRRIPSPAPEFNGDDVGDGGLSTSSTPYSNARLPDNQNLSVTGGVRSALKKTGSGGITSGVWWPEEEQIAAQEVYTPRHFGDSFDDLGTSGGGGLNEEPKHQSMAGDIPRLGSDGSGQPARLPSGGSAGIEQPPQKPRRARRSGVAFPNHVPDQEEPSPSRGRPGNEMIIRIGGGSPKGSVPAYRQRLDSQESDGSASPTPKAPPRGIRRSFAEGHQPATPRIPRSSEFIFGAM